MAKVIVTTVSNGEDAILHAINKPHLIVVDEANCVTEPDMWNGIRDLRPGVDPLYSEELGWRDWPQDAKVKDVLKWFAELIEFFLDATEVALPSKFRRQPLAQALHGSIVDRKLHVGFVNNPKAN